MFFLLTGLLQFHLILRQFHSWCHKFLKISVANLWSFPKMSDNCLTQRCNPSLISVATRNYDIISVVSSKTNWLKLIIIQKASNSDKNKKLVKVLKKRIEKTWDLFWITLRLFFADKNVVNFHDINNHDGDVSNWCYQRDEIDWGKVTVPSSPCKVKLRNRSDFKT